jgi:outer membrane receptor protein involved in Fe transport
MNDAASGQKKLRLRPITHGVLVACGAALLSPSARAQTELAPVIVSAQKRDQDMQSVPITINVLGSAQLLDLGVKALEDYVEVLPNVSFVRYTPATAEIYIRGISGGGNSELGSSSNVAVYLDEQPVTTSNTFLNPHIYDVARIEVLAGPQGTLFGANAQSGAIRIISNKPDPSKFSAGYDFEGNSVDHGDAGFVAEGFLNFPLMRGKAALRLVGWYEDDAGYIDNVPTTHTFSNANIRAGLTDPALIAIAQDITVDNSAVVKDNFNTAKTTGGRAALSIDLNDNWTATAMVLRQKLETDGVWDHDPTEFGDLQSGTLLPSSEDDEFTQTSLTLTGQLGNMTLTYAGSYLDRRYRQAIDYSLYSDYYISGGYIPGYYSCYVAYFGACVDPRDQVTGDEKTRRWNHEIRLASDPSRKFRFLLGAFYEDSKWISDLEFHILGLSQFSQFDANGHALPGLSAAIDEPDIYWTTDQNKFTTETAFFGQLEYDFTDRVTGSVSARHFDFESRVFGFAGTIWWPNCCFQRPDSNVDLKTENKDTVMRANLSWSVTDDIMLYTTYAEGYRPGGINRAYAPPFPPAFDPDFLDSYEIGAKTTLADGRLRLNGAVYWQNWDNFQLARIDTSIAPITLTSNIGAATSNGMEFDFAFLPNEHWDWTGAASFNDPKLDQDYWVRASDEQAGAPPDVPKGTQLARVPKTKWNTQLRYKTELMGHRAYVQGTYSYTGSSYSQFIDSYKETREKQHSYDIVNAAIGVEGESWTAELFVSNVFDERAEIFKNDNTWDSRVTTNRPRTIGLKFRQRF